jgi:hypothetical protein
LTIASYFNSFSIDDRIDVDEFLLEVNAEVAALRCAEELSGAHGDGGGGSSSVTEEGLLRPKPNIFDPTLELAGVPDGGFFPSSCFLVNKPMVLS